MRLPREAIGGGCSEPSWSVVGKAGTTESGSRVQTQSSAMVNAGGDHELEYPVKWSSGVAAVTPYYIMSEEAVELEPLVQVSSVLPPDSSRVGDLRLLSCVHDW